jgi:hypothetical protein
VQNPGITGSITQELEVLFTKLKAEGGIGPFQPPDRRWTTRIKSVSERVGERARLTSGGGVLAT